MSVIWNNENGLCLQFAVIGGTWTQRFGSWPGGGPAEMSGRWLIPAAGYYGVPTGKNGVAKMALLRLRIGAQITRKYAHNLLINVYTLNFYGKQH